MWYYIIIPIMNGMNLVECSIRDDKSIRISILYCTLVQWMSVEHIVMLWCIWIQLIVCVWGDSSNY